MYISEPKKHFSFKIDNACTCYKRVPIKNESSSMSLVNGLASREVTILSLALLVSPVFFQRFCVPFLFSHSPFLFITDDGLLYALLCTLLFRGLVLFSFLPSCLYGRNIAAQWLFALQHSPAAQQLGGTMWLGLVSGHEEGFVPLWAWSSKSLQLCRGACELCTVYHRVGPLSVWVPEWLCGAEGLRPPWPAPPPPTQHMLHV